VDDIHQRMGGQLQVAMFDKTVSNPQSHIAQAIAMFTQQAPDVALQLHVGTMTAIERGVLDGQYQIGIIPGHRSSDALEYVELFDETMLLYAGTDHPLMGAAPQTLDWESLRAYPFAGLGYHSPNMDISQQVRLTRKATGFDQEAIATLILSGQFLGFLPDHYAQSFVRAGQMRAIQPALFRYECQFFAITRRSPQPARAARAFQECLAKSHMLVERDSNSPPGRPKEN
jgi:DNA-binding transcriptional LysR family regulator